MSEITISRTDNRDLTETVLILSNGTKVKVNPRELFQNAVENSGIVGEKISQVLLDLLEMYLTEAYEHEDTDTQNRLGPNDRVRHFIECIVNQDMN